MSIKKEYDDFYETVEINLATVQAMHQHIHSLWHSIDSNIQDNSLKSELYQDAREIIDGLNLLVNNNKKSVSCFNSLITKSR